MSSSEAPMPAAPQARQQGLVVRQLDDEVLIYDLENDEAHCLNGTAALVWSYCDGKTAVASIVDRLRRDVRRDADERDVWLALAEFAKKNLLETTEVETAEEDAPNTLSRRAMIARVGATAAVPLIASLAVPLAASAASGTCSSPGGTCTSLSNCCSPSTSCLNSTCCVQPGTAGYTCTTNSQCCGGYCAGGVCTTCKSLGTTCAAGQCCSGMTCGVNDTAPNNAKCCLKSGQTYSSKSDCCTAPTGNPGVCP